MLKKCYQNNFQTLLHFKFHNEFYSINFTNNFKSRYYTYKTVYV